MRSLSGVASPLNGVAEARRIIAFVARYTEISEEQILGRRKTSEISSARRLATWMIHERTGLSLSVIARVTNRDRSSAAHAVKTFTARMKSEPTFQASAAALLRALDDPPAPPSVGPAKIGRESEALAKISRTV